MSVHKAKELRLLSIITTGARQCLMCRPSSPTSLVSFPPFQQGVVSALPCHQPLAASDSKSTHPLRTSRLRKWGFGSVGSRQSESVLPCLPLPKPQTLQEWRVGAI